MFCKTSEFDHDWEQLQKKIMNKVKEVSVKSLHYFSIQRSLAANSNILINRKIFKDMYGFFFTRII